MKDTLVEQLRGEFALTRLCRVVGASLSGYYDRHREGQSAKVQSDALLLKAIRDIFVESHESYGSPRIAAELRSRGLVVNHKRVERIMRSAEIVPHPVKRFRNLSKRTAGRSAAPNRLQQHFVAAAPNQIWLADCTQFVTHEGTLYLALVLDLFSRRVVGWQTGSRLTTDLVLEAMRIAFSRRRPQLGTHQSLVHHSDQGAVYTSHAYQEYLLAHAIQPSMSDAGNCYDNAPMESFIATLKKEWTYPFTYATRSQLTSDLFDFIESVYNRRRSHSALAYRSPAMFEVDYDQQQLQLQLRLEEEEQQLFAHPERTDSPPL